MLSFLSLKTGLNKDESSWELIRVGSHGILFGCTWVLLQKNYVAYWSKNTVKTLINLLFFQCKA